MSFSSPGMFALLVLIPVVVAAYVAAQRRRARRAAALAGEGLVATPLTGSGATRRRRHTAFGFFVAALALLVVALARPSTTIRTPHQEGTVIVALDTSNSMRATDVTPSRMEVAKTTARAFVNRQPAALKIGVVAFGDGAVVVQWPTTNHLDAIAAINRVSVGGGTSIGQGLLTSLDTIAGKQITVDPNASLSDDAKVAVGYYGGATVVAFTDGENTDPPDPLSVAQVDSVAGVRVHTVGVGTESGTVVQVDGFSLSTALDSDALKQIASSTGGSYHAATDANGPAAISKTISLHFKLVAQHSEVTGLFCAAAAGLLLLGSLASVRWFGRIA